MVSSKLLMLAGDSWGGLWWFVSEIGDFEPS